LAFAIVCATVIYLRRAEPNIPRPFKVPFYPWTPILGVFFCIVFMMGPIALYILVGYAIVGALIYIGYGYRHSKLRHGDGMTGHEPPPLEPPLDSRVA